MKLVIVAISMFIAMPSFGATIYSTRVFSTDARSERIPADFNFQADKIHVNSPVWYMSIFEETGCERSLSEMDINTPIAIMASGPAGLMLSLNGHVSQQFAHANVKYVPLYYRYGQPVHPHFLIRLKNWVLLHAVIHRSGSTKTLQLSLIQGRGDDMHLVPILEATGR